MIGLFFRTSSQAHTAMTSYVTSSRPQFFLHFPGSGGTSIHAFALALYGRNSTRWNNGCHAEQFSWRAALRAQDRCNCSTAVTFKTFHAHENPVMAPICAAFDYWVVLRHPVDRVLSRLGKSTATNKLFGYRLPILSAAQATAALRTTTWWKPCPQSWYCAVEGPATPWLKLCPASLRQRSVANVTCAAHEFSGSAGLDNFHVRSLNGPAVYRLPLGAITDAHLERAAAWLSTAAVVLPLANLSALPRLLGVDVAMPHEVTGAHSTRRDVDPDLRALLEAHNGLDIRLYQGAQALFERRMASLPRDNR